MELVQSKKIHLFPIAMIAVLGFFAFKKWISSPSLKLESVAFNYEMPRPKAQISNFDLSGREVDREYLSDPKAQERLLKDAKKAAQIQNMKTAKKSDTNAAKKDAAAKGPQLKVSVVDNENRNPMSTEAEQLSGRETYGYVYNSAPAQKKSATAESAPPKDNDSDLKMTASQWRTLLFQNTNQNIGKFIEAFNKKFVTEEDFFQIASELLNDSSEPRRKAALMLYTSTYSKNSFELIAKEYPNLSESDRAVVWKILLSFGQMNKLSSLVASFSSNDGVVLKLALQVLSEAVKNQKIQKQSEQEGKRSVAGGIPVQALQIFIPSLTKLSQNADATISQTAQAVITDIQALLSK